MAVDALEMAPLVDAVQRKGVYVTAVSTLLSKPPMISTELRRSVDHFVDLRELVPSSEGFALAILLLRRDKSVAAVRDRRSEDFIAMLVGRFAPNRLSA